MLLISYISIALKSFLKVDPFVTENLPPSTKKKVPVCFLVSDGLVSFLDVLWIGQNIPQLLGSLWPAPSVRRLQPCWNFLHVCLRGQLGEGCCMQHAVMLSWWDTN